MKLNIELFETDRWQYTVIVNGKFADGLTIDEALGVVASALFSKKPLFVRSYEDWHDFNKKYKILPKGEPIALLGQ